MPDSDKRRKAEALRQEGAKKKGYEAFKCFLAALQEDPHNAAAWNDLGWSIVWYTEEITAIDAKDSNVPLTDAARLQMMETAILAFQQAYTLDENLKESAFVGLVKPMLAKALLGKIEDKGEHWELLTEGTKNESGEHDWIKRIEVLLNPDIIIYDSKFGGAFQYFMWATTQDGLKNIADTWFHTASFGYLVNLEQKEVVNPLHILKFFLKEALRCDPKHFLSLNLMLSLVEGNITHFEDSNVEIEELERLVYEGKDLAEQCLQVIESDVEQYIENMEALAALKIPLIGKDQDDLSEAISKFNQMAEIFQKARNRK